MAQLVLWSVILISGFLVLGLYNIGFGGLTFGTLDEAASVSTALKAVLNAFNMLPTVPPYLFGLLGITVATPFLSRLISNSSLIVSPQEQSGVSNQQATPTYLDTNESPSDAQLSDIVVSEVAGQSNRIDTARVQNVAITGILVVAYSMLLFNSVSVIEPVRVIYGATNFKSVFAAMPPVDGTS